MTIKDLSFYDVVTRDGARIPFDGSKIRNAIANAFLKDADGRMRGNASQSLSTSVREKVDRFTEQVIATVTHRNLSEVPIRIEDIQDQVELVLMRAGEHDVARDYVLFRERRAATRKRISAPQEITPIRMIDGDAEVPVTRKLIHYLLTEACDGMRGIALEPIVDQVLRDIYNGIQRDKLMEVMLLAARSMIERDPDYDYLTARVFLYAARREVIGEWVSQEEMQTLYPHQLFDMVEQGIAAGRLDRRLAEFDLERLGETIQSERDLKFRYIGLQTLYDRYFIQVEERRIELPQTFFMRIAMGLALNETDRDGKAIEFYEMLSSFRFMCSTPTLFNAGTVVPQLSSCYVSTVSDDLDSIYQSIKENALLQKYAGGIGNDWSSVRALGSVIRGTNGKSQGVVPFLKVVNDTAVAVNQGGKRKGAVCAYLETWHLDIEEFLELRKNVGDDRRRTHDMNTANWIPDLFMKRVIENDNWTLFSPVDVPDLHGKYGRAFDEAYLRYEAKAAHGEIKFFKTVAAVELWRKMLSMLFETGHPWICFKDPCNIRSPQQHVGTVHGSNLCTEITLNTSASEIAVCNLGSVNLAEHLCWDNTLGSWVLDRDKLSKTVSIAMRMLDNVIDLNHYAVDKAKRSNLRHRPVGLGVMGLQDCLYTMGLPFASLQALEFSTSVTEALCYFAFSASVDLAEERGVYATFEASLWDRGILPMDSIDILRRERGGYLDVKVMPTMDWGKLRWRIGEVGMRNSNCVAFAPTATIANIVGVFPSIEPAYQNLYVKSNLSGEFTVINEHLIDALKIRGLWDELMVADLKYFEGSVQKIDRVPEDLKAIYATAFEVDASFLIEAASRRQVWIDQAQSLNLFFKEASSKALDDAYRLAWKKGLKTTYYLRALGASSAEKSTARTGALNAVMSESVGGAICTVGSPDCESCQ